MSSKAITIYTPSGTSPHIAADDDAFIYDSLLGGRSGILGELTCQRLNDSTIRLMGGGVSNRGYILWVPSGEYCDLAVTNGSQGLGRHDIVAAQFTRGNGATADEHCFVVVEGAAAEEPSDPIMTESQLRGAGDVNQIALFRIVRDGLSITAVERIAADAAAVPSVETAAVCTGNAASATTAAACTGHSATASLSEACSGNAATASALESPVTISLSGNASGSVSFDGSGNVTLPVTVNSVNGTRIFLQQSQPASPMPGDLWIW